jgi:hypothetical protein
MVVNSRFRVYQSGLVLTLLGLLLTACGSAGNKDAVAACKAELLGKIEGKMAELDEKDMLGNAVVLEDGNIRIESAITYRRGTEQESTQTFHCVVAADDSGRHTRVIGMGINP